ncbi:hypothetical protein B0H14DRAFT_2420865 [Mycena olivaceomarginata]|nr:hypothetical protein B0H14DRAFT_2420865 [Mycena olivaceomarginata]
MADPEEKNCSSCHTDKPLDQFKPKGAGHSKTCLQCSRRKKEKRDELKRDKETENRGSSPDEDDFGTDLGVLSLTDFLDALMEHDEIIELGARVDISSISGSRRECADALAGKIREQMKYRFNYQSKYDHKRTESTRFMYHCAQSSSRQHKPKKNKREGAKSRDKIAIDTFPCNGWLHITIMDWDHLAYVKIKHDEEHIPYYSIDIPPDVVDYVHKNHKLTTTQLWDEILKVHPNPPFSRKAIHSMWAQINATEWKRDPDELKSAKIILEDFSNSAPGKKPLYTVESIPLPDVPDFTAIAFCLPNILREVGGRVRELSLDSACESDTNGSRYEVFALLGEMYGSGMPLGYLLIQFSSTASAPAEHPSQFRAITAFHPDFLRLFRNIFRPTREMELRKRGLLSIDL